MSIQDYKDALANFSQKGQRWAYHRKLVFEGYRIGLTAEDIINDANNVGVFNRNGLIRNCWKYNKEHFSRTTGCTYRSTTPTSTRKTESNAQPTFVRDIIGDTTERTLEDLIALSPVNITTMTENETTTAQLSAMFTPDELVCIGIMNRGVYRRDLNPLKAWMTDTRLFRCEQVKINPFTGKEEDGGSGKTLLGNKCVAHHRHALLEFDALPIEKQACFWCEVVERELLPVVTIIHSGNKSIHGLIRLNALDRPQWDKHISKMKDYFCSASEKTYQADIQALKNPSCAIRLAGVTRSNGIKQRLLYLNNEIK